MERTITVKGIGKVSQRPDLTIISFTLKSMDPNYDQAMETSAGRMEVLQRALSVIGFQKQDLKTTEFGISAEYKRVRDKNDNVHSVFEGYCCRQRLKLAFDFDTEFLSKVLSVVASCTVEPDLDIQFSVKDKNAVSRALLEDASRNAREKAEILAQASGVKLGRLLNIDYHWDELDIVSCTRYDEGCGCGSAAGIEIEPDDIDVNDTVTFIWAIE